MTLEFRLTVTAGERMAVITAAKDMGLPLRLAGESVFIDVASAEEAYLFGAAVGAEVAAGGQAWSPLVQEPIAKEHNDGE